MRIVRMRLGGEFIELTEYIAPKGRPIPVDSRSNDRWFQHIAIIVSDMDKAYAWLRKNKVEHASSGPQLLPDWNKKAAGISAFYFKDPDGHPVEVLQFPPDKGVRQVAPRTNSFRESITQQSSSAIPTRASSFIAIFSGCELPARARITAQSKSI